MSQTDKVHARLAALQRQLQELGPVMRGSVTLMGTRHKQPYFSVSINGKTRVIYLGKEKARTARVYAANYRKLARLVDSMTLLQMELLKGTGGVSAKPSRPAAKRPGKAAGPKK